MNLEAKIIVGDCRETLKSLPDNFFRTVVTSPPYWGLRDYGFENQIGQELDYKDYIKNLVEVFREIRRTLKDDGTVWLNLGDTYVGTGHKKDLKDPKYGEGRNGQSVALNNKVEGFKSKDMMGLPWRVAFALQEDGWYLRSDIVWQKGNVMPEPVRDRPTKSHEFIFLLTKSKKYFYNQEAVKEPTADGKGTRNLRDVWNVNTKALPEAHFAVYPVELINPCIKAATEDSDWVLDPFNGSGTTGIASLNLGRNYVGLESNPEYVSLATNRILKESGVKAVTLKKYL
jgi:DNA modification methylase